MGKGTIGIKDCKDIIVTNTKNTSWGPIDDGLKDVFGRIIFIWICNNFTIPPWLMMTIVQIGRLNLPGFSLEIE